MSGTFSRNMFVSCCLVAVWACMTSGRCTAAGPGQPPASTRPADARKTAESNQPKPLLLRDSEQPDGRQGPPGSTTVMWKMLAYMLVILALGALAILVTRKVLPRVGVSMSSGKRITTVETAYLGPRKTVHLLQVGTRKILIGAGREGLSFLADVTDAFDRPHREAETSDD